jgi:hypothetical protein
MEPALGEVFSSVSELLTVSSALNEHVTVDDHSTTAQVLTGSDTHCRYSAACRLGRWQQWRRWPDRNNERGVNYWFPEFRMSFNVERCRYPEAHWNSEMFEHNVQLDQFVAPKMLQSSVKVKGTAVPLRSIEAHLGDRRYSSYSFLTSALEGAEWSASRPGRALPPRKEPPVPTVEEAWWAPEPVWAQRLEGKSSACVGDRTPTVQSVVRHCTDSATQFGNKKINDFFKNN